MKKVAIISHRAYRKTIEGLLGVGYEIILVVPYYRELAPITSHPDLQIFPIKEKIIIAPNLSLYTLRKFQKITNKILIVGRKVLQKGYPSEVPYNGIIVGNYLISNLKYIDPVVLKVAKDEGLFPIHVNQGYVRCTTLPLNNDTVLTEDPGIAKTLRVKGIDVIFFEPGYVEIDGYKYGFFAGASGIDKDILYINGDIELYPYKKELLSYLNRYNIKVKSLASGQKIKDIGSIFFVK